MTKKSRVIRKRYIAFRITAPRLISRNELISAIRENIKHKKSWNNMKPWLTIFENNQGILSCVHTSKSEAIELLSSLKAVGREKVPIKVETLGTSGTIKKARNGYLACEDCI